MQDIGGIRAVVNSLATVRKLESDYDVSRFGHELISRKDYIASPKQDGYRGIHLVFRYKNSRAPAYEGLLLELQIRTRLQHAWATAVETMGTFLGQALKSHQGEHRWLKFFELAGAAFAHLEKSPLMPDYQNLTRAETFDRLAKAEKDLRVLDKLRGFTIAVDAITTARRSGRYHLVILNSQMKHVEIQAFAKTELEQANAAYTETENRIKAGDPFEAVLVSAGPIESLRRAYPNYFLDTEGFIKKVEQIIKESARSRFHGSPNQVVKP